jgi:hypothetical protein
MLENGEIDERASALGPSLLPGLGEGLLSLQVRLHRRESLRRRRLAPHPAHLLEQDEWEAGGGSCH